MSVGPAVYVSYAWRAPDSPAMAGLLQEVCARHGIELRRDSGRIGYGDSIRGYMQGLGAGGAIVVLISEAYLRSRDCMYELLEIEKHQRFRERVHPIVLEDTNGFDFYQVKDRLKILKYWETRAAELEEEIAALGRRDHLADAYRELDLCADIRRDFVELTATLADMYSPRPGVLLETEFAALIERIQRVIAAPAPAPLPAGNPLDDAFARALAKTIDKELQSSAAGGLRTALAERLKAPATVVGAALCALDDESALAVLTSAIAAGLRQAPRGEVSRELRAVARRLLGWLLMRLVRAEWSAAGPRAPADPSVSARVEVGSEAGAEVLWAHWSGVAEPPDFRVIRRRVLGSHSLLAGTTLPEEGWEDWIRYLDDAKAALWVALFGEQPPAAFAAAQDKRLRDAFAFDHTVHGGARFYLTVRDADVTEPLAQPMVLEALRRDLGLPVLFVTESPDDRFISIGETRLQDLIKQCLKILKEHGDD